MEPKALISIIVIILTLAGYVPYIRDIIQKKTRPHAFTWFSVSLSGFISYGLQVLGGAGVGAIPMLVVSLICVCVFGLSLWRGTKDITRSDVVFLGLSLVALFLWLVVKQPILSVILITCSEVLAYVPTIRKSWKDPHSETLSLYQISMFRHGLAIAALEKINILTALYPAVWALTNVVITGILVVRRRRIFMKTLAIINPRNVSESEASTYKLREAARAVVVDEQGLIAILHVSNKGFYKLPGGGLESGEDKITALKRECKEEIGCDVEVIAELGSTVEYWKEDLEKQISYCYFAKVVSEKGEPTLTENEKKSGHNLNWLPYDEVISRLKGTVSTDFEVEYIVPRELMFLEEAKKYL